MQAFFFILNLAILLGTVLPFVLWGVWRASKSRPGLRVVGIWAACAAITLLVGISGGLTLYAFIWGRAALGDLPMALASYSIIAFVPAVLTFAVVFTIGAAIVALKPSKSDVV